MARRIEVLAEMAAATREPLSPCAATYFANGTQELTSKLHVDYTQITDFMQKHGLDQHALDHTFISFHPSKKLPGADHSTAAFLSASPKTHEGHLFYPHIALGVHVAQPNLAALNDSLRHELRHLTQESTTLLYHKPGVVNTLRGLGYSALAVATVEATGVWSHDFAAYIAAGGLALAGTVMAAAPGDLLHFFSEQEAEAKQFAQEHAYFQPISATP